MHVIMVVTYGEPKKGYLNFTLGNLWATQPIALLIWPPLQIYIAAHRWKGEILSFSMLYHTSKSVTCINFCIKFVVARHVSQKVRSESILYL